MSADELSPQIFRLPRTMEHGVVKSDPARQDGQIRDDPARAPIREAAAVPANDLVVLVGGTKGQLLQLRTDIAELVRTVLVSQSALSDAVTLAADQIQDKRIDWLEEGPEVSFEAFVFELMLGFALESTLAGKLVGRLLSKSFPYARNKELAKRVGLAESELKSLRDEKGELAADLQRKQAELTKIAGNVERAGEAASAARAQAQHAIASSEVPGFLTDEFHELDALAVEVESELASQKGNLARQQRLIGDVEQKVRAVSDSQLKRDRELSELKLQALADWFKLNEPLVTDTVGALKAVSGVRKSPPTGVAQGATAPDSFGTQLKRQALARLRTEQDYLRGIEQTADTLVSVGLTSEPLAPVCISRLQTIARLLRIVDEQEPDTVDESQDPVLFYERLMWALLYADRFDTGQVQSAIQFVADVGIIGAAAQPLTEEVTNRFSKRMLKYWRDRFFPTLGEDIGAEVEIVKRMKELKSAYLAVFMKHAESSAEPVRMLLAPRPKA
jgi:hypothetical protein